MFSLIPDQRRRLLAVAFTNTILGFAALIPPYVLKVVIDSLVRSSNESSQKYTQLIIYSLLGLLGVHAVMAVFEYIQERISDLLRLDTIIQLRKKLFKHVLELSIDYYETHRAGEIVERVTESIYSFGLWLQDTSQAVLLRILTIIFSTAVLLVVNPLAGLIVAATVSLRLTLAMRKKQVSRPYRQESRKYLEKITGTITEAIQNLTTLRSFGGEHQAVKKYDLLAAGVRDVRIKQHTIEWRYNSVAVAIEGVGIVAAVAVMAYSVLRGQATAGDVLLVALYMQQAIINQRGMAGYIDLTSELVTSCERVLELMDIRPTVQDEPNARKLNELKAIEFRDVSFTYPGHEKEVLKEVSFRLTPGDMLALVGPSGTGKTTIVKLLLRLYEHSSGEILINGKDIREFTADSLRQHIGTVMQDVALFNETFADNVKIAKPEAKQAELEKAVELAHAAEFVKRLPDGYQTLVGERGIKLSGGQKQRVAIARAILKQPNLVILDEATSALDSQNEREVQKGLNELLKGRMSVVIAHRLSTVKHASEILVIEEGSVVERGTHEQLIKHNGTYAMLFKLQSERL
jgi:ABC-type multidrug transport system fused ATPase/permease subunit